MFLPILSGLIVSVDAFFIGLSLGLQKKCRFLYLCIINLFLFGLCMLGFLLAGQVYEHIPIDPDYVVGFSFIALGLWTILHHFVSEHKKRKQDPLAAENPSRKTIVLVGLVMSVEAMLITMGITLVFHPESTLLIPLTVALAHFGYSVCSFFLARTKHISKMPAYWAHTISGAALIIYGLMALFVELGI